MSFAQYLFKGNMEAKKTTTQEGDQETPLQSTSQGSQGQMTNPYGYGFPFEMPYQYPQPSVETIPKLSMAERFTIACNRM